MERTVIILFIVVAIQQILIIKNNNVILKMNRKLDAIAEKLGLEEDYVLRNDIKEEIEALVKKGENVKAIKLYRINTGEGLKEAKERIDKIEIELKR